MVTQKEIFRQSEGDNWHTRNEKRLREYQANPHCDPVLFTLGMVDLLPRRVCEIGASDGWRLEVLRKKYGCEVWGVEPSQKAVMAGKSLFREVHLEVGSADHLPFEASSFDCLTFGFCLYLCDRDDLPQIVSEADRVLKPGGHLIIYDFFTEKPMRVPYAPMAGVFSYKMDYSSLFDSYPNYSVLSRQLFQMSSHQPISKISDPNDTTAVFILKKQ